MHEVGVGDSSRGVIGGHAQTGVYRAKVLGRPRPCRRGSGLCARAGRAEVATWPDGFSSRYPASDFRFTWTTPNDPSAPAPKMKEGLVSATVISLRLITPSRRCPMCQRRRPPRGRRRRATHSRLFVPGQRVRCPTADCDEVGVGAEHRRLGHVGGDELDALRRRRRAPEGGDAAHRRVGGTCCALAGPARRRSSSVNASW